MTNVKKESNAMKMKNLLLICGAALTLTACSQNVPAAEDAGATKEEAAITDEAESASETVPEDSVEESADPEESGQSGSSLLTSPEVAFQQNLDENFPYDIPYDNLKITFAENEYTDYLYDNFLDPGSEIAHHATIFGFNAPQGYESDIFDEEMHFHQHDFGEKQALRVSDFQDSLYPEYPSTYAFLNQEDFSSLYLFALDSKADDIRNYLQNGTPLSILNTDKPSNIYPTFLSEDSVSRIENMDTLDTVYGSCDILFMELESPDTSALDYYEATNPIYIEAAYFSLQTYYTYYDELDSARKDPHFICMDPDIVVIYMYPNSNSETAYEGHLAQLLPDMLTPAAQ